MIFSDAISRAIPFVERSIPAGTRRVVVGMSGGVDSAVAALLLKKLGLEVIGLFMKNWEEPEAQSSSDGASICTAEQDFQDVARVCEAIDIPYYSVEFIQEYWDNVFEDFLKNYRLGVTPNPDVLCNREIKFKAMLERAQTFGCDVMATGHYARINRRKLSSVTDDTLSNVIGNTIDDTPGNVRSELFRAVDLTKDQSYFLYMVNHQALSKSAFPLGELEKKHIREIALHADLPVATKKDSTGICFIGERNFRNFLSTHIEFKSGPIKILDTGETIGEHQGIAFHTIGQRKGLGLGGAGEPWFVAKKDPSTNTLFVVQGVNHEGLFSQVLTARDLTWISGERPKEGNYTAKARYRQEDKRCRIEFFSESETKMRVLFEEPQRAITSGQSVVIYDGDHCLGGGIIT